MDYGRITRLKDKSVTMLLTRNPNMISIVDYLNTLIDKHNDIIKGLKELKEGDDVKALNDVYYELNIITRNIKDVMAYINNNTGGFFLNLS